MNVEEILNRIYDSEINFKIETFWDGGFDFFLGSKMNGFEAESNFRTIKEGVYWLTSEILKHYPNSDFSKWFKIQEEN